MHPFQVLLGTEGTGIPQESKAQAAPVRPVAVERVGAAIGLSSCPEVTALDDARRLHLAL